MHSGFAQFAAFDQDAIDNKAFMASGGKLEMPVFPSRRKILRAHDGDGHARAATNVQEGVVPESGHWIMEENPTATVAMVRKFLDAKH